MRKWTGRSDLRVLLYHRIEHPAAPRLDLNPDLVSTTPRSFERHLAYLTGHYNLISAEQLLAAYEGRALPPRAVLVTFDDGYRDFMELAWPIIKRYRAPAVLFVPTLFVSDRERVFWWDMVWQAVAWSAHQQMRSPRGGGLMWLRSHGERRTAARALTNWLKSLDPAARADAVESLSKDLGVRSRRTKSVLSWDELRRLASEGLTVAAHSRSHELLDQLTPAQLRDEVYGSRDDLQNELGVCPPLFAYPNGNCASPVAQTIGEAGFALGFTTLHGLNDLATADPHLLRRDSGARSLPMLAAQLTLPIALARTFRHPMRRSFGEALRRA